MTPAQLDKLRRIDAHLANLLSTAEKRTPGEWVQKPNLQGRMGDIYSDDRPDTLATTLFLGWTENEMKHNAAFIASCAGNAEAGWRATRAAIHQGTWLMEMDQIGRLSLQDQGATHQMLTDIIAAFPNV